MATAWPEKRRLIGKKHRRVDGPAKSTGTARYSFDINRTGMLHARILRCPHAHATIKSVDLEIARKMPGVRAIYVIGSASEGTVVRADAIKVVIQARREGKDVELALEAKNAAFFREGKAVKPVDLKKDDKVWIEIEQDAIGRELFYAGDEVLALAADTEEQAHDALRAVKVEYAVLDFLVLEQDALKEDKKTVSPAGPKKERENIRPGGKGKTEGFEKAMKTEGAVIHEGEYHASNICHQCLESHGLVAEWDQDGGLTVWASTQAVAGTATALAGYFSNQGIDLPASKVKCITHHMGGGYGSKFGPDIQGTVCAELARKAKKPVKLMLDRAEEVTAGGIRPSAFGKVTIAATKDGKIVGYDVDSYGSPGLANTATVNFGLLPYVYAFGDNRKKHTIIRLNTQNQRAMRAPGHPQSSFLTDTALDDVAAKIGMDPMEVRLKNLPPNDAAAIANAPRRSPPFGTRSTRMRSRSSPS